jgi:hypothetical protein
MLSNIFEIDVNELKILKFYYNNLGQRRAPLNLLSIFILITIKLS